MKKIKKKLPTTHGFSLVELLIYIALLSIILIVVVNTMLAMTRSYGAVASSRDIETSAIVAMDRLVREIREADDLIGTQSVFGTHPGKLVIKSTAEDNTVKTTEFSLNAGRLRVKENNMDTGPLTVSNVTVSRLVFSPIISGVSKAVKIEMEMQSGAGQALRSAKLYNTVVLRGSY